MLVGYTIDKKLQDCNLESKVAGFLTLKNSNKRALEAHAKKIQ